MTDIEHKPFRRTKFNKDDLVIVTESGRIFTTSGMQLDKKTGRPLGRTDKTIYVNGKPVVNDPKLFVQGDGLPTNIKGGKVNSKVTVTKLKNSSKYQMHGFMQYSNPNAGIQCLNQVTITCDSKFEADDLGRSFKELCKEEINLFNN
jgi:hypothetical protein